MVPLRRQWRAGHGRLSRPGTTCWARGGGRGSALVHQWRSMWHPVLWETWRRGKKIRISMGFPWDFLGGFFMEVLKLRHFLRAIWVWDIDTETFEIVWNVGKAGHLAPTGIFGDGVSLRGSCRFPLKQELQDTTKSAGHAILYIIISIYIYIFPISGIHLSWLVPFASLPGRASGTFWTPMRRLWSMSQRLLFVPTHGQRVGEEGKACGAAPLHIFIWLVVWNMNFIFPYIGKNHPNNQRGRSTTNQSLFILFECN